MPEETQHPAVALQRVQGAQHGGDDVGFEAVALQREQAVVERLEVRAGILQVDAEELRGDLEVAHAQRGLRPAAQLSAVIFSMSPCSSEAWKGFLT